LIKPLSSSNPAKSTRPASTWRSSSARILRIPISSTTRDLCYVDLGQLDQGRELLHRCLLLAPGHSHACVALALGYQRAGDLPRAREYTMQALAADPRNPVALKNLGAILGKEGDCLRALYYLRRSYEIDPQDSQTVYGLAFAYMESISLITPFIRFCWITAWPM
jgi:tetratricopeptide (TPR) repeat protein